jgi:peptidoglycan hydrolase-like amidase
MQSIEHQPTVRIGLMNNVKKVAFTLQGDWLDEQQCSYVARRYHATADATGNILIDDGTGRIEKISDHFSLHAFYEPRATFTVHAVTIGVDFHWQRQEDQQFTGGLHIERNPNGTLRVINEVNVEDYLTSVISSEMSATAHPELLKAHAIISRSWLLAQLPQWRATRVQQRPSGWQGHELINWYDRDNHAGFDICADDHCQRYQGLGKASSANVAEAIHATAGVVLSHGDELCDARFSKSCGGFTELFPAAWQDADVPYLQAFYDGEVFPNEYALPLNDEANAARWIRGKPAAFCCTEDRTILQRILPSFDQETEDFYRWSVVIQQDELQVWLKQKLSLELGAIHALKPLARGASGRITRLRIVGERDTVVIGKELEIRRALSASHLYSSAFIVECGAGLYPAPAGVEQDTILLHNKPIPSSFTLLGAGWGHGVGLCQIGAALMAERGYDHQQILRHYYRGASLSRLYRA